MLLFHLRSLSRVGNHNQGAGATAHAQPCTAGAPGGTMPAAGGAELS